MPRPNHPLELLAPAKNADFGIAAIKHGADAVYIGGPAFGARYGAGNTVADIERLSTFAHRYHAKVFVALNTILRDDELEDACRLTWQIHEAGADALIIQDMGLLEMDLPPIQLHASTQTDNRNPAKVRFLEDAGFSQVVLARELSLNEIINISSQTTVALEYFVHGALCVAFSGQCFISHAHTGRSANRGECSQACRLPYTLVDDKGRTITENQHLLSMKDNNQSENILELARVGVSSFKIEGRLKDLSYVKNITAHYRSLIDDILEKYPEFQRASSGRSTFTFTPQPEKTYNRGYTDYFANDRQDDIGAFDSPAFVGEPVGEVAEIGSDHFTINSASEFHNGDGVSVAVDLRNDEKTGREVAKNAERATATLREQLGKFGNTMFVAQPGELQLSQAWFLPTAAINALRRAATEKLEATPAANPALYPQDGLTYLGNVFNAKARQFYEKHGVRLIADAYEANQEKGMVSLMITRHCLRYSLVWGNNRSPFICMTDCNNPWNRSRKSFSRSYKLHSNLNMVDKWPGTVLLRYFSDISTMRSSIAFHCPPSRRNFNATT